jgi:uncharacterized membrane protein
MVNLIARSVRRLALKIASYGVMHLIVAILVAFAITRDWRLALAVGVVEPIFQTLAYTVHDRVWHRVEQRVRLSNVEEAAEAVSARIDLMDPSEQARVHGHQGAHSHAFPRSLKRVALKTVTYGVMHFTVAVTVALALTHDWRIALTIGITEPVVQTGFFAVHDRIWSRIEARKAARRGVAAA